MLSKIVYTASSLWLANSGCAFSELIQFCQIKYMSVCSGKAYKTTIMQTPIYNTTSILCNALGLANSTCSYDQNSVISGHI